MRVAPSKQKEDCPPRGNAVLDLLTRQMTRLFSGGVCDRLKMSDGIFAAAAAGASVGADVGGGVGAGAVSGNHCRAA